MIPINCFRCLQISFSTDGVRCSRCDNEEASRTPMAGNFPSPVSEPGNVSPGYYVPAADASTQTTEDDFLLLEPTRDASSQTTDSDFSLLAEINACHGHMGGSNDISSSQVFHQDSSQHKNPCSKIFPHHLLPNDMQVAEQVPTHDRKRKGEKDQMIPDNSEGHFGASTVKRMRLVDDSFGIPGPSGLNQNNDTSNLSAEKSQSGSSLQLQNVTLTEEKTWICDTCQWDIGAHYDVHEGKMLYKCCACDYKSSSRCELQKHATIHDPSFLRCNICGEFNFETDAHGSEKTCDVCKEKFQCRTLLEEHSLIYEDYFYVYCRYCRKKIEDHITASQIRVYKCCKCKYETYKKFNLQNHYYIHSDLRLFKCDICGRRFTQKDALRRHLNIHCRCKKCKKSFTSTERLEEHFKQVHTWAEEKSLSGSSLQPHSVALTEEKTWICDTCQRDIGAHYDAHEGNMFYKCCACYYESSSKCELQKHLRIHPPLYSRCNICGEFRFQKDAHGNEKTCDVCKEKFQCRTLLEEHSVVHKGYYVSNCRLCGHKINYHLVIYQEKQFYKCCKCQHKTNRKINLRKHLYIHRDLRLFKCQVCGRRFKQKSVLLVHLRIHFKCKRCGDSYTSTELLEEHFIQTHTRDIADSQIKNRQALG